MSALSAARRSEAIFTLGAAVGVLVRVVRRDWRCDWRWVRGVWRRAFIAGDFVWWVGWVGGGGGLVVVLVLG